MPLTLWCGQHGAIYAVALHDGNAAARALRGSDGDTCTAQGLDIPLDRSAGHLELRRQIWGGDPVSLEQDGQNANQPIHFHIATAFAVFVCIIAQECDNCLSCLPRHDGKQVAFSILTFL